MFHSAEHHLFRANQMIGQYVFRAVVAFLEYDDVVLLQVAEFLYRCLAFGIGYHYLVGCNLVFGVIYSGDRVDGYSGNKVGIV